MTQSLHDIADERALTTHLSESESLRLLSSARRRTTLDVLADHATPIHLEDLAAAVADRDPDADVRSVTIELHHVHLPKMAHKGVIDYDYETRMIE